MSKVYDRYIGAIGGKAIEIPIGRDLRGSGVILPPLITVNVDRARLGLRPLEGRLYVEMDFVLVDSQEAAARAFEVDQQTISRWLTKGNDLVATNPDTNTNLSNPPKQSPTERSK